MAKMPLTVIPNLTGSLIKMKLYSVFVDGVEFDDSYFINHKDAEQLAQKFITDGANDAQVVVVPVEKVLEMFNNYI